MPRNAGGTFTLPAGNPVISGTTITTTWANATLNDLATAMTDSLARSGQGAMLAPLKLDDGFAATPGLTWATELDSGIYRAGAEDFGFVVNAVLVQEWYDAGVYFPLYVEFNDDVVMNAGLVATGDASDGVQGTGDGSGRTGVLGTGGADGVGVWGAGTGTGSGVRGVGGATGAGVQGTGGATSGAGVSGAGSAGNAVGVVGAGFGSGAGVSGTGGGTAGAAGVLGTGGGGGGNGGTFLGVATGSGLQATGGATSGLGGDFVAGTGGTGITAAGNGAGTGVLALGGSTGIGVEGRGGGTSGPGVLCRANNTASAPLRLIALAAAPGTPVDGDIYYDSGTATFYGRAGGAWVPFH